MRLRLILGEALSGLRRNTSMVISVILVTSVSLTFLGAALLLQMQLGKMEDYWSQRAQVSVFMCSSVSETPTCTGGTATQEQTDAVTAALESTALTPLIRNYSFESSDDAYANLIAQFGDQYSGFLTADQVSSTFHINLVNHDDANVLKERFGGFAGVETVTDQLQYLDPLFDSLRIATYLAVGVASLMLVAAVLLVGTTIRQSAFARRKEIGIMRLVGASNRFIQAPFVLEGVLAAVIGSALATVSIWALVHFGVEGFLQPRLTYVGTWISANELVVVVPVIVITGVVLAGLSATFAIRRWLRA